MTYLFSIWCLLAVGVLSMAGYRKTIANREDDLVHLNEGNAGAVDNQKAIAARLSEIDKWGQLLTIVTVVLGLILAGIFLYNGWNASGQLER